jgi:hypothetical protein
MPASGISPGAQPPSGRASPPSAGSWPASCSPGSWQCSAAGQPTGTATPRRLVAAYSFREDGVLRFLRHLIYVGAALVTLLLCTSSYSYLRAAAPDLPSSPVAVGVYAVGCALYALGLPVGSRPLAFMLALRGRLHSEGDRHPDRETGARHDEFRAVDVCAWAALGYLAVAATGGSLVIGTTDSAWDPRPVHLIYAIALSSVVAPIALLAFALHACAPEQTSRGETPDADTAPSLARGPSAD